jgi:hypothetical protein
MIVQNKGVRLNTVDVFQVGVRSMVIISPDILGKTTLGFLYRSMSKPGIAVRGPLDV